MVKLAFAYFKNYLLWKVNAIGTSDEPEVLINIWSVGSVSVVKKYPEPVFSTKTFAYLNPLNC